MTIKITAIDETHAIALDARDDIRSVRAGRSVIIADIDQSNWRVPIMLTQSMGLLEEVTEWDLQNLDK